MERMKREGKTDLGGIRAEQYVTRPTIEDDRPVRMQEVRGLSINEDARRGEFPSTTRPR